MKKILISLLMLLLSGCSNYVYYESSDEIVLKIDSININNVVSISSINDAVDGIALFDEYGRPNVDGTNTIIGAHSGYGSNAYFNYLHTLIIGDKIELIYMNNTYKYEVSNVYDVDDTELSPLSNKNSTMITLMTCKIGDSSKRTIVEATLISNI